MSKSMELIQEHEQLFDRRRPPSAENFRQWVEGSELSQALYLEDWEAVKVAARKIFEHSEAPEFRAFAIQWGVAACETIYNPVLPTFLWI